MDMGNLGRVPPQAIESEQSVVGSVMLEAEVFDDVVEIISADDFYREDHRVIFETFEELNSKSCRIDIITVADALKAKGCLDSIGGFDYLSNITNIVPTTAAVKHYSKIVREKSLMRKMIKASTEIMNACYEGKEDIETLIQNAEAQILQINEPKKDRMCHAYVALESALTQLDMRYKNRGMLPGLPTGFVDIDYKLGGLQKGDLIIIAGRPSMGKTALAEAIAIHASMAKKVPTAFFSMEMSKEKIINRALSGLAMVDNNKIKLGTLDDEDWNQMAQVYGCIYESKLEIDDTTNLKVSQIRSRSRRLKKKYGELGLIVIDHLTEMWRPMKANKEVEEYSENIRATKRIAKEMDCPVVLLQQLSRKVEGRNDKRPILSDLRETGVAEEVADVIMMIYRDDYYNPETEKKNIAEIIITKGRDIGTGTIELCWMPQYTKFASIEKYKGR